MTFIISKDAFPPTKKKKGAKVFLLSCGHTTDCLFGPFTTTSWKYHECDYDDKPKVFSCHFCNEGNRRGLGFDKPQLSGAGPTCGCVPMVSFGHTGFTGTIAWADPENEIIYVFLSNRTFPDSTINKFPVNEGFKNFDFLYFLFSLILLILQIIGPILLLIYHLIAFLWNNFAPILLPLLIAKFGVNSFLEGKAAVAALKLWPGGILTAGINVAKSLFWAGLATILGLNFSAFIQKTIPRLKLPMITYPDCQACNCNPDVFKDDDSGATQSPQGLLSQLSNNLSYFDTYVTNY
jgi:hypothetical protein